jgi:predicted Zn-dependent peptidase
MLGNLTKYQLDNELEIIFVPTPTETVTVIPSIKIGSLYETLKNATISHLLEHGWTLGTSKRKDRNVIYREMRSLFGDWKYTYFERYVDRQPFGWKALREDFEASLDLLSDLLFQSRMESENIEREKSIIESEMKNSRSRVWSIAYTLCYRNLYSEHPVWLAYLDLKSYISCLYRLTPKQVKRFYANYVTPDNMVLFVVGDVKNVPILIDKYFGLERCGIRRHLVLPKISNRDRECVMQSKGAKDSVMVFGGLLPPSTSNEYYALEIAIRMLGTMLFERLTEKERTSYYAGAYSQMYSHWSHFVIYANCDPLKERKVKKAIKEEITNLHKTLRSNLLKDVISSLRRKILFNLEDTLELGKFLDDLYFKGRIDDFRSYPDRFAGMSEREVLKVSREYIRFEDLTKAIVRPKIST